MFVSPVPALIAVGLSLNSKSGQRNHVSDDEPQKRHGFAPHPGFRGELPQRNPNDGFWKYKEAEREG